MSRRKSDEVVLGSPAGEILSWQRRFDGRAAKPRKRKKSPWALNALRLRVLKGYGCSCACCGERTKAFLELDHVNNDGAEERRRGVDAYRRAVLENFPSCYQLLCANCNTAKFRYGRCPHSTKPEIHARARRLAEKRACDAEQRLALRRYVDSLPPITSEELGRLLG